MPIQGILSKVLALAGLVRELDGAHRARGAGACVKSLQVKIRFADFHHATVELAAPKPQLALFHMLLERGFARAGQPLRLLGLGVRLGSVANASGSVPGITPGNPAQRSLFADDAAVSDSTSV